MSLHPKRSWPDKWSPCQGLPFACCMCVCCASMGQHVASPCNFFKNSSWFGKMICDLWTWQMLCFQRKGKWRHSQFDIENRCIVIPICEVNTEELRVRVRVRENGTWTSEQSWVLGRSQLKHRLCATSSGGINSLDKFFNVLSAFGKNYHTTYGEI